MKRVIRYPKVEDLTGLRHSAIYERIAAGTFPKPIGLGGRKAVGWIEDEVLAWIEQRIAERDGEAA